MEFEGLDTALAIVGGAQRLVVLTGAGISTESGIPDFRGPQGVWTTNPGLEKASNIHSYRTDDELRQRVWQRRLQLSTIEVRPNRGHEALVGLERQGRLHALVTQNIDGLHSAAGHEEVIEVHGNNTWASCLGCGERRPMADYLDRVREGDPDPRCEECGGIVKGDVVMFGEALVPHVIEAALRAAEECDVLLAVGTTLSVSPVNGMVPRARHAGASIVIVNGEPTDMDRFATAMVRGPIGEILPILCAPPA
ncbi:MAG: SIR2 family NAD-dependent protein deacylase [Ilumatobacteraceae bacterium]